MDCWWSKRRIACRWTNRNSCKYKLLIDLLRLYRAWGLPSRWHPHSWSFDRYVAYLFDRYLAQYEYGGGLDGVGAAHLRPALPLNQQTIPPSCPTGQPLPPH